MTEIWFVIFIVLLFIELITVNLVSIWFAVGSLAALIVSLFIDSITIQTIVFIVVSIIVLLLTKKITGKLRKRKIIPTNYDRIIGQKGIVIKNIANGEYGEVKVNGSIWTASASKRIIKGSSVKIERIDGVKVVVKEMEDDKK